MKTKNQRQEELANVLAGDGFDVLPLDKRQVKQSNSAWSNRPLTEDEQESFLAFEGLKVSLGDKIVLHDINLEQAKFVSNEQRGSYFYTLADTGNKSLTPVTKVKLGNKVFLLKYRLTLALTEDS